MAAGVLSARLGVVPLLAPFSARRGGLGALRFAAGRPGGFFFAGQQPIQLDVQIYQATLYRLYLGQQLVIVGLGREVEDLQHSVDVPIHFPLGGSGVAKRFLHCHGKGRVGKNLFGEAGEIFLAGFIELLEEGFFGAHIVKEALPDGKVQV